jgi:hypothetical protein
MDELKSGQQVVIKSAKLSGIVIGPRSAVLKEDRLYKVQISEQTLFCREENLVPWPEPGTELQRNSAEWCAEYLRFVEMSKQYLANPSDKDLFAKIAESGMKIGFLVPRNQ